MEVALDVFGIIVLCKSLCQHQDNVMRKFIEAAPTPGAVLGPAIPVFCVPGVVPGGRSAS